MKKIIFTIISLTLSLLSVSKLYSQNGRYDLDPLTKRVTNYNVRYDFSYAYSYDFDLREASRAYSTKCIVVIEINEYGTGRLVSSLAGDKVVCLVDSCIQYETYFKFICRNKENLTPVIYKLGITNNKVDKFWVEGDDNKAVVFSN